MVLLEPSGGEGVVHRLISTDAPCPFTGVSQHYRGGVVQPQFLEVSHFRSRQFPLFPTERPQPSDDPAV